jgi:hypothetical protein
MARQVSAGQQRVDALVSFVRNDASADAANLAGGDLPSIEEELGKLRTELSALETALVQDVILVATHPEIQAFDIALQRIDRILKGLRAGG